MHGMNWTRRAWLNRAALIGMAKAVTTHASAPAEASEPGPSAERGSVRWKDRTPIPLKGRRITLSEPVLVKRSRWFCWFPSLIRQPSGTLWALVSAYADVNVTDSFCYLSRSRDGGLTWDEPRIIGDGGTGHLLLPDGSAAVLPYYLRPRPGGVIGAPCNVISPRGQLSMLPSGMNVSGWPRSPGSKGPELGTAGFVFNGQVVPGRQGGYLTTLYGRFEGDSRYSLVFAESADGFAWRVRSVVAGADCPLPGGEGPCESATARLADGRLLCVFRLASFVSYGRCWSDDDGKTWSRPENIPPQSVEPSLAVLPDGVVALSGGRPGIFVWFSVDGGGADWQAVDILAHHNASRPRDVIHPDSRKARGIGPSDLVRRGIGGFSSCYSELVRLDDSRLLLIYDRLGLAWHQIPDESPETNSVWVLRITVEK